MKKISDFIIEGNKLPKYIKQIPKRSNIIKYDNSQTVKLLNKTNLYEFICPLGECVSRNNRRKSIGYTTTTLSCSLMSMSYLEM